MMPHYMNYQSGMPVWYGPSITEIVWCCKILCIRTMIALQRNLAIGLIISKKCGRRAELPNVATRWNIVQSVQDKFLREELSTTRQKCISGGMLIKPMPNMGLARTCINILVMKVWIYSSVDSHLFLQDLFWTRSILTSKEKKNLFIACQHALKGERFPQNYKWSFIYCISFINPRASLTKVVVFIRYFLMHRNSVKSLVSH